MPLLFQNINELKAVVGGGANLSLDIDSLQPTIHDAARDHLWALIGEELYMKMVDIDEWDSEQLDLVNFIRRSLGKLALYEYAKIGTIQFGESGMFRVENDNHKTAYKYQENQYKKHMLDKGYEAAEELLNFLEVNEEDYPLWQSSEAYDRNKSLFINTAADFRKSYSLYVSRYTFEVLRPLMEDVEAFAILPLLGDAQYDTLKDAILLKALNSMEKGLLLHLQKCVAHFTIFQGLQQLWIKVEGKNIVNNEALEPQSNIKQGVAQSKQMSLALRHAEDWGNRHLAQTRQYLHKHIGHFPDYQEHLNATTESENLSNTDPQCATDRHLLACGCHTYCNCHQSTQGIVRL